MTITQAQQAIDLGLDLCGKASPDRELDLSSQPVIQPQSIQELLRESSRGKDLDRSLMTGTSAVPYYRLQDCNVLSTVSESHTRFHIVISVSLTFMSE